MNRANAFEVDADKSKVYGAPLTEGCLRNIYVADAGTDPTVDSRWLNAGQIGDILIVLDA